jgi:hypothetical protein
LTKLHQSAVQYIRNKVITDTDIFFPTKYE